MIALVCFLIGTVGFGVHWAVRGRHWTDAERLEHGLRWWFAAGGVWLFISGIGHVMIPDEIAETIGWPTGSPFQREVGFTDLAWGVLGVASARMRGSFREAYVIGTLIFLWGAAGGHIYEMVANDNTAPNNSGVMLYVDLLAPVVNAALLWRLRSAERGVDRIAEASLQPSTAG